MSQCPVPVGVFGKIGVQEKHRHGKILRTTDIVSPGAELHGPTFYQDRCPCRHFCEKVLDHPIHGFFPLPSVGIELLIKITLTMKKRYPNQRNFEVGGSANRISS